MNRFIIGSLWDRHNRNGTNMNFEYLFEGRQKIDELNVRADNILNEAKKTNDMNKDVQSQIDAIILESGTSDAEVVQARGEYQLLKDRLTATDSHINKNEMRNTKYAGQADFVSMIEDRTQYDRLRLKKSNVPAGGVEGIVDNGYDHVTHLWQKHSDDDFWLYVTAYAGALRMKMISFDDADADDRTGTWQTGSVNIYATAVGSTFTQNLKGQTISFNHMTDNRGGVWEFTIDGDTINPVRVSTFSSSPNYLKTVVLFDGLDTKNVHTVVGTFIGDDPNNTPSSGAGTSRGWVRYDPTGTDHTMVAGSLEDNGNYTDGIMLLGYNSNKEFAFEMEIGSERHFFPTHNGVGTAFNATSPKFFLDGREIDINSMQNGEYKEGDVIEFIQDVYCRFPNTTGDMARLKIVQTLTKSGVVTMTGTMEILKDLTIHNGYTSMFPLVENTLRQLLTGIGNTKINSADGAQQYFPEEEDKVYSFAGIDSRNKDYISAVTIDYPVKSLRLGEDGRAPEKDFFYFWQRSSYPKLYGRSYFSHVAKKGEKYTFASRYASAKINNIYDFIK